jgi:hypothetical protein
MSSASRRIAVLAALSLVALVVVAVPALATQTVKINSRITLSDNPPAFHGRVKSSKPACEQQRKVKLFKQRSGPDQLLGNDKSDNHGKWKIVVDPLTPGDYYAKVVRREEGTAGTIFVCRGDRSRVATIVPH